MRSPLTLLERPLHLLTPVLLHLRKPLLSLHLRQPLPLLPPRPLLPPLPLAPPSPARPPLPAPTPGCPGDEALAPAKSP